MPASRRGQPGARAFASMPDEKLLGVRLCDLPVSVEGSELGARVGQLHEELAAAEIRVRPRVWLSDEWFAPKDASGIAAPFCLAHPRLKRLERKMMLEVEGGTKRECMKILRHEAGHVVQFAFGLHRRRRWREVFGRSGQAYPESFEPKPYSRRYVLHIEPHYAQAHPDEDFAETFAVWLTPGLNWRSRYKGWGALKKLRYVDELMAELRGVRPPAAPRRRMDELRTLRHTLGEHYEQRQAYYGVKDPDFYTRDLRRLFSSAGEGARASAFLRRARRETLRTVSAWTGQYRYTLNDMYEEMIARCDEHDLRVAPGEGGEALVRELTAMVTVLAMNAAHEGGRRIKL